jgi:hypothetical protein
MKKHLANLKMLGINVKEHELSTGDMCNGLKKTQFEKNCDKKKQGYKQTKCKTRI